LQSWRDDYQLSNPALCPGIQHCASGILPFFTRKATRLVLIPHFFAISLVEI